MSSGSIALFGLGTGPFGVGMAQELKGFLVRYVSCGVVTSTKEWSTSSFESAAACVEAFGCLSACRIGDKLREDAAVVAAVAGSGASST
jgi:hypothetical protein